ncbi:MAG: hypothetical protein GF329_03935 [Candidatus Lokiarchaeota archaeon]|nr:hypothetical protein [Candidatus Lokiarchaeota archaeon]
MKRDKNILEELCLQFCQIIEKFTEYVIISGFLVISSGRSRGTEDIDVIIKRLDLEQFKKMHNELKRNNFECLQSSKPEKIFNLYLTENLPVRYCMEDRFIPNIEMKFAKDKLDEYQLENRKKIDFTDIDVFFSSVEATIAFKEEFLKSKKDLEDAKHLRIVYKDSINKNEIQKIKYMINKYKL